MAHGTDIVIDLNSGHMTVSISIGQMPRVRGDYLSQATTMLCIDGTCEVEA